MRIPLLIVGGGIGGLAAALALSRAGRPAYVIEKAPQFSEIGAGLQIAPNATRMLDRLGILDEVREHAMHPKHLVMRDALSGDHLTSLDLGRRFLEHFGYPYIVMHRADLLNAELRACQASSLITLEANREAVEVEDVGTAVRVVCSDGSTYECDGLIGADGLWSRTRKVVHDDGHPVCAESVAYRSSVPSAALPAGVDVDNMTIWVGPNLHFVQYIVRKDDLLNQVAVFRSDRFRPGHESLEDWGTPEELDQRFALTCAPVQRGVARIDRERRWAMFDRPPLPTWTRNRVTLLGDAAHPMLQYAAQGACQALEDAVCLGETVGSVGDPREAFLVYQSRRMPRATRVQQAARFLGDFYHVSGSGAQRRQQLLGGRASDDFGYFDWLFGYRGCLDVTS